MRIFAEKNGFDLTIEKDEEPAKRPTKSRITKVSINNYL